MVVTNYDGQQYYTAAFPEHYVDSVEAFVANTLFGAPSYGDLIATAGAYKNYLGKLDYDQPYDVAEIVLHTDQPYSDLVNKLNAYAATVNEHHIVYGATTSNSNAYAHEAVTVLGVGRPDPIVDAPGHDTKLIQ